MLPDQSRTLLQILGAALFVVFFAQPAAGGHGEEKSTMKVGQGGMAIKGYDTVAYFTEGKAIVGSTDFQHTWREAEWNFTSAKHRAMFVASPEKYAPQFGAFCALGVSMSAAVEADPEAWTIVDDKLYMNYNLEFREKWRADKAEHIEKANAAWAQHSNAE